MISRTLGIALRVDPFSKTSHLISWLTPTHGRVLVLAKGAQRPKNFFLGQYDLFYTCEVLFYDRQPGSLRILKECCPVKPRAALRDNWPSAVVASYLCGLCAEAVPEGASHPEFFAFLDSALDFLASRTPPASFLHWCELHMLILLGVGPQLMSCMACGRSPERDGLAASFHVSRGGILCSACDRDAAASSFCIGADVLAILRNWQQSDTPEAALRIVCSEKQATVIERTLRAFLQYHAGTLSPAGPITLDMLARHETAAGT